MLSLEIIEALTNDVQFVDLASDFSVKLIPLGTKVNDIL